MVCRVADAVQLPWQPQRVSAKEALSRIAAERDAWKTRAEDAEAQLARLRAAGVDAARVTLRADNERLRAENATLRATSDALREQNEQLREENKDLKRRLQVAQRAARRQAAPFRRRKRKQNPKKPGRKMGHPPANRPVPDHVDEQHDCPVGTACPDCGGEVEEDGTQDQYVVEIPEVKPHVTKYTNHYGHCKRCGRSVHSRHPKQTSSATGAAGVQLGPRVLAVSTDLKERLGVPYRKVVQVLGLCFDLKVSAGALARAAQRITKRCEPSYDGLVIYVRQSAVVHADETSWYIVNTPDKPWLWVFATPEGATVYIIRPSRGADVPRAILGETFGGKLVVDGWVVYGSLGYPLAQCNAHLLARCAKLLGVQCGEAAEFPQQVKELLQAAMALGRSRPFVVEVFGERFWERAVRDLERRLDALLKPEPADLENLRFRDHLWVHQQELLVFLHDPAVAPTNNLGEREIRPAVVMRKISAGNRTEAGAHAHEVLGSLTRTAERGGVRFPDLLPEILQSEGRVVLTPERLGLPPHPVAPTAESTDGKAPRSPCRLRSHRRRPRRVRRTHSPTGPP